MSKKWSEQLRDIAGQMEASAVATTDAIRYSEAAHRELKQAWSQISEYKGEIADLRKLLAERDRQDGWIEWRGGECPLSDATIVEYRLRAGYTMRKRVDYLRWQHVGANSDIIAYRVVQDDSAKDLQATIDGQREELAELRGQLMSALETKESAIAGIEYRDVQFQKQGDRLRKELAAAVQHCEIKQGEIEGLRHELAELRKTLALRDTKLSQMAKDNAAANAGLTRQRALNATLVAEADERGRTVLIGVGDILGRYDATVAKQRGIA